MNAQQLLQEISDYCRHTGLAESTFGRRAVNDGKLTAAVAQRRPHHHRYARPHPRFHDRPPRTRRRRQSRSHRSIERARDAAPITNSPALAPAIAPRKPGRDPQRNFRFFDNRQKYLLFVNTCSEKWEVASRVAEELANIHPRPPAVRVFDAGVGDGTRARCA